MRFYEIASGYRLPVSQEEQEIIDKIPKEGIAKSSLDEREEEVARLMVSKGLLTRTKVEGATFLKLNSPDDLWRI